MKLTSEWWGSRLRGLFRAKKVPRNGKQGPDDEANLQTCSAMEDCVQSQKDSKPSGFPSHGCPEGSETPFPSQFAGDVVADCGNFKLVVALPATPPVYRSDGVLSETRLTSAMGNRNSKGNNCDPPSPSPSPPPPPPRSSSKIPPPPPPRSSSKIPKVYVRDKKSARERAEDSHRTQQSKQDVQVSQASMLEKSVGAKTSVNNGVESKAVTKHKSRNIRRVSRQVSKEEAYGQIVQGVPSDTTTETTQLSSYSIGGPSKYSTKDYALTSIPPKDYLRIAEPCSAGGTNTSKNSVPHYAVISSNHSADNSSNAADVCQTVNAIKPELRSQSDSHASTSKAAPTLCEPDQDFNPEMGHKHASRAKHSNDVPEMVKEDHSVKPRLRPKSDSHASKAVLPEGSRGSKRTRKERAKRVSRREEEVRRLAHSMVGSIESLISNLSGMVGDLQQLVQQIDTVTESIDHTCGHRSADCSTGSDHEGALNPAGERMKTSPEKHGSPRKRLQKQRTGSVPPGSRYSCPKSVVSNHAPTSPSAVSSSEIKPEQFRLKASPKTSKRFSYPQCARALNSKPLVPQTQSFFSDPENKEHGCCGSSGDSKGVQHVNVHQKDGGSEHSNTAEYHYVLSESPKAGYVTISIADPHLVYGANETMVGEISPRLSSFSPKSPASVDQKPLAPSDVSAIRASSEGKRVDCAKDSRGLLLQGASQDKNLCQTQRDSAACAIEVEHNTTITQTCESPAKMKSADTVGSSAREEKLDGAGELGGLPDTGLENWKAKLEGHCGSVESLTPQLDWSYLALTDQHSDAATAGLVPSGGQHIHPLTAHHQMPHLLSAHHQMPHPLTAHHQMPHPLTAHHQMPLVFAQVQPNTLSASSRPKSPSESQVKHQFSPLHQQKVLPDCLEAKQSTEDHAVPHSGFQQRKADPSKLTLQGLSIKHPFRDRRAASEQSYNKQKGSFSRLHPPSRLPVLPQGRKRSAVFFHTQQQSAFPDQATFNWKYSDVFPLVQSQAVCGGSGEQHRVLLTQKQALDETLLTRKQALDETGVQANSDKRNVCGPESGHTQSCVESLEVDSDEVFPCVEKTMETDSIPNMRDGKIICPVQQQITEEVASQRNPSGISVIISKSRSSSDSVFGENKAGAACGVFPHVAQRVGGASLGWNTSDKALPGWPSVDLSSIETLDTETDDLSSPFLPQHFHYPRRSSARDQEQNHNTRAGGASSASDQFSPSEAPALPPRERLLYAGKRSAKDTKLPGNLEQNPRLFPNANQNKVQTSEVSHSSSDVVSSEETSPFSPLFHCSYKNFTADFVDDLTLERPFVVQSTTHDPSIDNESSPRKASCASESMTSGGFEVGGDVKVEVSPECDVTGLYVGQYECVMETRLEQLASDAESDFSDTEADAGSDVLGQSLTSLETSGSAKYDRDVNTWKSYTMTHIDSDDVVSECASDILNENFIETATSNPGFDDVNLNFDDVNFPSIAY